MNTPPHDQTKPLEDKDRPASTVEHLARDESPAEVRFGQGGWELYRHPERPCFQVPFPQEPATYVLDLGEDGSKLTLVIAGWDGDMQAVAPVPGGATQEQARLDRIMDRLIGAALDEMYGVEFGTTEVAATVALESQVGPDGDYFSTIPANATGGGMVARVRLHPAGDDVVVQLTLVRDQYAPFLPPLELTCDE